MLSLIGFHLDEQKSKTALNTLINQTRKASNIAFLGWSEILVLLNFMIKIILIEAVPSKVDGGWSGHHQKV